MYDYAARGRRNDFIFKLVVGYALLVMGCATAFAVVTSFMRLL